MKFSALLTALCLCLFSLSCMKKDTYNCNFDACAIVAPAAEVQEIETYLAANNITGAVKHCSGLYYRITAAGTGATPTNCSVVAANYKGMLKNGTVFDQSSTAATTFELSGVIRGWQNGIPLIKEGGKMTLYIPPTLGYGARAVTDPATGATVIPANSMLIFDITLVASR